MAIRTTGVVPEGTPFLLLPFGRRYPAFQLRERYVDLISHDRRISSRASHAGRGRAIPRIPGIDMYGNSIPTGTVGGDLFEYINFQQRYDIDASIQRSRTLSKEFLEPLPPG